MGILDGWRYCPHCGGSLRAAPQRVECEACGRVVWAGSAVTVSALCVDGSRIMLARRAEQPGLGLWNTPGGFVDEGEHPLAALSRELDEETGLSVEPLELIGIFMDRYEERHLLTLHWLARVSGEPVPADDVSELRWFEAAELPGREEFAFANVWEAVSAWRRRHEHA